MGAWPVFAFFGLDVPLRYWASELNYRHAAAHEEVTMTPVALTVRKVNHRGRGARTRVNLLWVRLRRRRHQEFASSACPWRCAGAAPIANFLGPHEKASFATALGKALAEAKRGVTRTAIP